MDSDLNVDGDADVQSVVGANVTVNPPPVLDVDKLLSGLANMFDSSEHHRPGSPPGALVCLAAPPGHVLQRQAPGLARVN